MQIYDLLKEYNSKKRYFTEKDEAMESFVRQKTSIDAISSTLGFKAIKDYWTDEAMAATNRLRTMKTKDDMMRVQGELDIAMGFLDFLSNLLAEKLTKEDLDILTQ